VTTTPDLIDRLAREASPVRRLAPPLRRAALFLAGFAVILLAATVSRHAWPDMIRRLQDVRFAVEMGATALTGVVAVYAAFALSVPGRSPLWLALPAPPLAVWLAASGYGCYRNWFVIGPDGSLALGRSSDCFIFILVASLPLAAALFIALRRARPLNAAPVMCAGALGVAALAATALQFFHPFDVTVADLGVHILAALLVIVMAMLAGAPRLGPAAARTG
jgi:hypothetical protein